VTSKRQSKDVEILTSLAEYRCLSIPQLAALHFSSLQTARTARGRLDRDGLVEPVHRGYGKKPGRPDFLLALSEGGINRLKDERILPNSLKSKTVSCPGSNFIEHQLLLNWVCIHVRRLGNESDDLGTGFFLSNSKHLSCNADRTFSIADKVTSNGLGSDPISFIPDGVFCIESIAQRKALLFFVEIDMATETVSSSKMDSNDFHQKIKNYQAYFRTNGYKRYEKGWRRKFKGFRLLVVTNTSSRMESLCRLVEGLPPSDFVWLTHESLLLDHGISGKIWTRGGRLDSPPESILGPSLAHCSPILPIRA